MNKILKSVASLVAGVFAFVVVGVGVTAALDPYVWPSAILGLPAGIAAGLVVFPFTFLGLTYWSEQREEGQASPTTRRRLWTLAWATAGFVVGAGLGMAVISTQAVGLSAALLFAGFPFGVLTAVIVGYLAFRRKTVDRRPPGSAPN